ncbi:MAG: hypothetical protein R3351_02915 [Nitrospirales bacterium]|nr:hypothetical protein [Nitrospirales bacterium]
MGHPQVGWPKLQTVDNPSSAETISLIKKNNDTEKHFPGKDSWPDAIPRNQAKR